jgi:hypothetical protein
MKNESAFPIITPDMPVSGEPGLTKLEYFAGLVMQAHIASGATLLADSDEKAEVLMKNIPTASVGFAKALISELEKHQNSEQEGE